MEKLKMFCGNILSSLNLHIKQSAHQTIRISVYLIICTLFVASCAQVVPPNGGKKDVKAPRALKYSPDSAQLNFNSKSIHIEFDEYAQLRDLSTQLVISPPLEKTPDINLKNKSLTITFDKDEILKPNTTYSIHFGNAIQDITENNPIENFKYIFSTGNYIDSASVNGKIKYAFDHKPEKGIMIMLYSKNNDSVIYKNQPDYFTKTNGDGTFQINNVKAGNYKIVALKDLNANYKFDNEAEAIGFVDSPIDITKKEAIQMNMFTEFPKKLALKKYTHNSYGKVSLFFNQGSDSIRVSIIEQSNQGVEELFEFSKNKDTLNYWVKNYDKDSLKLQVNNGNKIIDTLEIEMIKFEAAKKSTRNPLKLRLLESPNGNLNFDLNSEFKLVFNNPIATINEAPQMKEDTLNYYKKGNALSYQTAALQTIFLAFDSSLVHAEYPTKSGKYIDSPTFTIHDWKENTNYSLLIPSGTFTDIFGLKNDTIKINFKTRELKYYGTLKLTVSVPEIKGNYIIQLMDEKETVIQERSISKSTVLQYEYLLPMKYRLKIIKDENANGKWDTGNYIKKQQAEKVIYNPETIQIRSNWDAELEWKLNK